MFRSALPAALVLSLLSSACGPSDPEGPSVNGDPVGVAGAHEHGVARLSLTVEASQVFAILEVPTATALGFEGLPESDQDREMALGRVAALEPRLGEAITFPPELMCTAELVQVDWGLDEMDEAHDHTDEEHSEEDDHTDVRAEFTYTCQASPTGVDAQLAMAGLFPDLAEVDLTVLTEHGQAAARVSSDASFSF